MIPSLQAVLMSLTKPSEPVASAPAARPPGESEAGAGSSMQRKLERVRRPRLTLSYGPEPHDALGMRERAFVIGVLADFSGDVDPPGPLSERRFERVDRDNFDEYLGSVGPTLRLSVPNRLQAGGPPMAVGLTFRTIDDFDPAEVAAQIEPLRALLETREPLWRLRCLLERNDALEAAVRRALDDPEAIAALTAGRDAGEREGPAGPDPRVEDADPAPDAPDQRGGGRSLLESFCHGRARRVYDRSDSDAAIAALRSLIAEGVSGRACGGGLDATVLGLIQKIDATLSAQMSEILHDPRFRRLEATWRGLHYLVHQAETGETLRIRVADVRRAELVRDFQRAGDFDRTWLFERVHDDVFGGDGREAFGLLVGDWEFGRRREDVELLRGIAAVAAAAHAPFIAAAAPSMFGVERLADLDRVREIGRFFARADSAPWETFRESDDARYVGLTVPRVLLRLPYGSELKTVSEFAFEEEVEAGSVDHLVWGSAVWALAVRVADSYAKWSWPAEIRGVEGGGLVEGLPWLPWFARGADAPDDAARCSTDASLSEPRESELSQLGFIPLVHLHHTNSPAFLSVPSCQRPRQYGIPEATAGAAIGAQLPVVLAAARVIQSIRLTARDHLASSPACDGIESLVNTWIQDYVRADGEAATAWHPRPLREARIEVGPDSSRPGKCRVVAFLQFHSPNMDLALPLRFAFPIG